MQSKDIARGVLSFPAEKKQLVGHCQLIYPASFLLLLKNG
jgi:hypothetical protein